jgi:hypothetical protein
VVDFVRWASEGSPGAEHLKLPLLVSSDQAASLALVGGHNKTGGVMMSKKMLVLALALFAPSFSVAQTGNCFDNCAFFYAREQQGCMSLMSDSTRYNQCLTTAYNNYIACGGRCALGR